MFTNGIYDLIHAGHVLTFYAAKSLGGDSSSLIVGVNSDASTKLLKGPSRPVISQDLRAYMVASVECVDCVTVFEGMRCDRLITLIRPDIYYKAGYSLTDSHKDIFDEGEYQALIECNALICLDEKVDMPSTTDIIERIRRID